MARLTLLNTFAIPAAGTVTSTPIEGLGDAHDLLIQAKFDHGSGGTTVKAYVQTSLDDGVSWIDIASFAFTTADAVKISSVDTATALTAATVPTDGTLTDDTVKNGIIGDALRVKTITTGTYAASTLSVFVEAKN